MKKKKKKRILRTEGNLQKVCKIQAHLTCLINKKPETGRIKYIKRFI